MFFYTVSRSLLYFLFILIRSMFLLVCCLSRGVMSTLLTDKCSFTRPSQLSPIFIYACIWSSERRGPWCFCDVEPNIGLPVSLSIWSWPAVNRDEWWSWRVGRLRFHCRPNENPSLHTQKNEMKTKTISFYVIIFSDSFRLLFTNFYGLLQIFQASSTTKSLSHSFQFFVFFSTSDRKGRCFRIASFLDVRFQYHWLMCAMHALEMATLRAQFHGLRTRTKRLWIMPNKTLMHTDVIHKKLLIHLNLVYIT